MVRRSNAAGTKSNTACNSKTNADNRLPELINLGRSCKWQSDLHNEITRQLALAGFIREGHYLRHVGMKKHYAKKRRDVVGMLAKHFGDRIR